MDNHELNRQIQNIQTQRMGEEVQSSQASLLSGILSLVGVIFNSFKDKKKSE